MSDELVEVRLTCRVVMVGGRAKPSPERLADALSAHLRKIPMFDVPGVRGGTSRAAVLSCEPENGEAS